MHTRRSSTRWIILALTLAGACSDRDADGMEGLDAGRPLFGDASPDVGWPSPVDGGMDAGSDADAASAPAYDWGSLDYDAPNSSTPVWDLVIDDASWEFLKDEVEEDRRIDVELRIGDRVWRPEMELQGYSTRTKRKKNFKFLFSGKDPFVGDLYGAGDAEEEHPKIIIKGITDDKSLLREALAWRVLEAMGAPAPRITFVHLVLRGWYWGLYMVVEPIDEPYIERIGLPPGGALYKGVDQKAHFRPSVDLDKGFEKKTLEDEPWEDLESLAALLQDTPLNEAAVLDQIDPVFPVDAYIDRLIWASYTQNIDTWRQNFYLYNANAGARAASGAKADWTILAWDSDLCFGRHWDSDERTLGADEYIMLDGRNHYARRLVQVDELRAAYIERYRELLTKVFKASLVLKAFETLVDRWLPDIKKDAERWEREGSLNDELDIVRDFIRARPAAVRDVLPEFAADPFYEDD